MSRALTTLPLLLALVSGVAAQPAPFDMTGEDAPSQQPAAPSPAPDAAPAAPAAPAPAATERSEPAVQNEGARRYLLPMERLTLSGETASRAWGIFLTQEEAAAARTVQIAYQSSILAAPEASRMHFVVNGQTVIDTPVQSPDAVSDVVVEVPPGVLRPGLNTIRFDASMRHRTDCTVQSTYDLWAELDGTRTFVGFEPGADIAPRALEDVRAVGLDAAGQTRFSIVVPAGRLAEATPQTIRLSQGLGVLGGTPNQIFEVSSEAPAAAGPGELRVFLGPAELIEPLFGALPPGARIGSFADFVPYKGGHALLITGPDWASTGAAVERLVASTDRPASVRREVLVDTGWHSPDVPLAFAAASIPLSGLGVRTEEFSGRRYQTEFEVGVPADFYATAYGEATLVVDMAYTAAVRPGSRFDISVNGNIATTLPIGGASGEVVRRFPIPFTMRHFRPGANTISIEAILDTEADAACLPGTPSGGDTRFVLFDSSELQLPDFARISSRPSLSALSGVGYPFVRLGDPLPLILGDATAATLSAGATLAGRIARTAGRPLPFDTLMPASAAVGRDALFVAPASRIPAGILPFVGVAEELRLNWTENAIAPAEAGDDTQAALERWSAQVGSSWSRPFERLQGWLQANFDLSVDALRITAGPETPFLPPAEGTLLVAQGVDPSEAHSWTVVSARSAEDLASGVARLAEQTNWARLAGRLTYHDAADDAYVSLPASDARLVASVEPTFSNLRLVAANWLSERPLVYALVLAFGSILLGAATATLASNSGRGR